MGSEMKRKANVVRISDGLGNQLFQYAFGYGLYKRTGRELCIDPMYSGKLRHYQLDSFSIDFRQRFVGEKLDFVLGLGVRNAAPFRLKYREQKIRRGGYDLVKEEHPMEYDAGIYRDDSCYYIGFWQSYQYFDAYYDDIKRQFQYKGSFSPLAESYLERIQAGRQGRVSPCTFAGRIMTGHKTMSVLGMRFTGRRLNGCVRKWAVFPCLSLRMTRISCGSIFRYRNMFWLRA